MRYGASYASIKDETAAINTYIVIIFVPLVEKAFKIGVTNDA